MSGGENEERPRLGAGGAGERIGDSVPSENSPILPGIDGAGDGNCLLSFLRGWSEGGPWWPTAIPREGGGTETRTFTDLEALAAWVAGLVGVKNLYFSVNDLSPNTREKASKDEVTRVRGLHVDIDPRAIDGGVKGKTPEQLTAHFQAERARIWAMFDDWEVGGRKLPFPRPTAIIDSGGGYQGFWLFAEGEEVAPDLAERLNEMISAEMGGDKTHDVSRIMRLPGTVNLANKKKRESGRGDVPTRLVAADWSRRFRARDFPAPAVKVSGADSPVPGGRVVLPSHLPRLQSLDELGPGVTDRLKAMIVQGTDPDDPGKYGSRSEAAWAVMCMMVRAGCTDDQIAAVILDPDYKISGHVLDQPKPREYAARQIARAKVEAVDPELAELNARHVVIQTMGPSGKCRIMERLPTPDGRGYVAFQSFEDFGNRYDNRLKVVGKSKDGKEVMMPLGKWWKQKPERRQHKTLVFLPGGADVLDGDALNLWNGFAVRPAPGSWELMRQHIHEVLADGDAASAEYITKWAAYAVQHPGSPAEAALVFRGDLGTGKGAFGKAMMKLFGQHGIRTQGAAVLDSRFNVHLRDCVLLFADEVDWDSRRSSSQLKGMVTEPSLFIEPKGVDATNQPNYLHIIIASNNDWVIPAAPGERRFAAFRVSDRRMGDKAYFNALFGEMEAGGLAAMLHDLLAMDLTGWHPRFSIPQTRELSDQKLAGLSGADAIVREMLMGGVAPGVERAVHDADRVLLVRPLIRWALDNRIVATDPGERRMAEALKLMGVERRKLTVRGVGQKWVWPLPPLGEARAAWAAKLGLQVAWPDDGDWATFPG